MERERKTRALALVAMFLSVIGISIGYAAMSTTLNIKGTTTFDTAKWDIKFKNLSTPTITGNAEVVTAPTLSNTAIQTYKFKLTRPGDSITYKFDVANDSPDMDAIIGTFTKPNPTCTGSGTNATSDANTVCSNLVYTLTYTATGAAVGVNDTLAAGEVKNLTLKVGYDGSALPTNDVEITGLDIAIIYNQN